MRLTDRISQNTNRVPVEQPRAFLGGGSGGVWRPKDAAAESTRELKIKVHNRLFESMDVSRMEMLDPALISAKVTAAIGDTLMRTDVC